GGTAHVASRRHAPPTGETVAAARVPAGRPTGGRSRRSTHLADATLPVALRQDGRTGHAFRGLSVSALVEIREVSKAFGGVQAVTRVSLDVTKGEIVSVIGPNGAGKTTVLNMVSGFYHPDTGRIALEGRDVTDLA